MSDADAVSAEGGPEDYDAFMARVEEAKGAFMAEARRQGVDQLPCVQGVVSRIETIVRYNQFDRYMTELMGVSARIKDSVTELGRRHIVVGWLPVGYRFIDDSQLALALLDLQGEVVSIRATPESVVFVTSRNVTVEFLHEDESSMKFGLTAGEITAGYVWARALIRGVVGVYIRRAESVKIDAWYTVAIDRKDGHSPWGSYMTFSSSDIGMGYIG